MEEYTPFHYDVKVVAEKGACRRDNSRGWYDVVPVGTTWTERFAGWSPEEAVVCFRGFEVGRREAAEYKIAVTSADGQSETFRVLCPAKGPAVVLDSLNRRVKIRLTWDGRYTGAYRCA